MKLKAKLGDSIMVGDELLELVSVPASAVPVIIGVNAQQVTLRRSKRQQSVSVYCNCAKLAVIER